MVVTYDDGTTDEIPMTAAGLKVKAPATKASGTKTVTIKAGKKSARFTVDVANNSFTVTYNQNYEGAPAPEVVETVKGQKAENTVPTREGYTFVGWYADADFTHLFDFKSDITASVERRWPPIPTPWKSALPLPLPPLTPSGLATSSPAGWMLTAMLMTSPLL